MEKEIVERIEQAQILIKEAENIFWDNLDWDYRITFDTSEDLDYGSMHDTICIWSTPLIIRPFYRWALWMDKNGQDKIKSSVDMLKTEIIKVYKTFCDLMYEGLIK